MRAASKLLNGGRIINYESRVCRPPNDLAGTRRPDMMILAISLGKFKA